MEIEKSNLYSRYKQDADACKHGYYGYEFWLEKKLIEAESELKKLRVGDVSGRRELLKALFEKHYEETGYYAMILEDAEMYLKSL